MGMKKFYVSASHSYILDKFCSEIKKYHNITNHNGYVEFEGEATGFFKDKKFDSFTDIEKRNIFILLNDKGQEMNFGMYAETRTLEAWIVLSNSADLICILENGCISTFFQPIVHNGTNKVYGYECLSRGVLGNGQYASPGKLFEAAKITDMVFNLDRQCRESAIKTSAAKKITTHIFINFLPTSIYNPAFCLQDTVKWAAQLEFDPKNITFEVVESESVNDINHLLDIINFYKSHGFSIALDDIGSGYSSLNMLVDIKPDYVKLDMNLIRDIHVNREKQSVVKAIVQIAKDFDSKIIAEGVETKDEYEYVKELDVDFVQGYYFAKPMPDPVREIEIK